MIAPHGWSPSAGTRNTRKEVWKYVETSRPTKPTRSNHSCTLFIILLYFPSLRVLFILRNVASTEKLFFHNHYRLFIRIIDNISLICSGINTIMIKVNLKRHTSWVQKKFSKYMLYVFFLFSMICWHFFHFKHYQFLDVVLHFIWY